MSLDDDVPLCVRPYERFCSATNLKPRATSKQDNTTTQTQQYNTQQYNTHQTPGPGFAESAQLWLWVLILAPGETSSECAIITAPRQTEVIPHVV